MGPSVGFVGNRQLHPTARVQAVWSEQFIPATHGFNQLKFAYGDPGYATQLAKLSTLWSEPQQVDLFRHGNNIASSYLEWNSNRAKDVALPARDDSIQPACPLPEKMPIELEFLRQELEIERKKNLDQGSSYQEELGKYRYFLKIEEDKVKDERKE